jgi:nicotinate-nucleotide pyrophosphorylase (carboxylating)
VFQAVIGAECGDECLLEAVLGVVRADRGHEVAEHVRAVLVEQLLKGWKRFILHSPTKRLIRAFRETVATMVVDAETRELVARALHEDLGPGDVTAEAVVPEDASRQATITQKQPGVVFGLDVAGEVFRQAGAGELETRASEGEWRDEVPTAVATVEGAARALLAGERTALNFLCHLSGVATQTAKFVGRVELTGARVLDTRKTIPGLRALEKAAVAAGGGTNHRMGLYDAILIKENHAAVAGGVGEAVRRARAAKPGLSVEVECRDLDEVREGAEAGADRLLLDNMSPVELREAVDIAGAGGDRPELEASGGITLANVREIAETGVDFVSVGALTHSAPALDLSMTIEI